MKLADRIKSVSEVERIFDGMSAGIDAVVDRFTVDLGLVLDASVRQASSVVDSKGFQKILNKLAAVAPQPQHPTTRAPQPLQPQGRPEPGRRAVPAVTASRPTSGNPDTALPPGEHATLTAALQYPDGLDKKRLGILTGYKRSSRDAYIARLAQKGLVETQGALLYPNAAGRAAMNGTFEPLPTGDALVAYWRARLPEGERRLLDVLLEVHGKDIARDALDDAAGYKRSSRDAYLTRLKARGLVDFSGRGTVRASMELFG